MDYKNDIFARLQNGESVESIAADLTQSLNQANEAYAAKKAEEEKAKKEAAAKDALVQKKLEIVECLIDDLIEACELWDMGDELLDAFEDTNPAEVVEVFDQAMPFIAKYIELQKSLKETVAEIEKKSPAATANKVPPVDPIEAFLNSCVRI